VRLPVFRGSSALWAGEGAFGQVRLAEEGLAFCALLGTEDRAAADNALEL